jgi:hypothetical protein
MKFQLLRSFLLVFFLVSSATLFATTIDKGFRNLDRFDYFQAKKYFVKSLKKYKSPAAFGLATIYYRQDNPFHNIDSAYKCRIDLR